MAGTLLSSAREDLRGIFADTAGVALRVVVISPSGAEAELDGIWQHIAATIDPDTQQLVAGEKASVAIELRALRDAGFGDIRGIMARSANPWRVRVTEVSGSTSEWRVEEVLRDTTRDLVVCMLDYWRATP